MRYTKESCCLLIASAIAPFLGGCSGGNSQLAPTLGRQGVTAPNTAQSSVRSALGSTLFAGAGPNDASKPGGLYIGQFGTGSLPEYSVPDKNNLGPRCAVTFPPGGVNGIAVNAHRVLYVPYYLNGSKIATFGPDCGTPGPTLVDPNGDAADVAISNNDDTVYASNANTGNIDVYDDGATSPTRTLSNSQYHGNGFGVAVDSHGNVFNSGGVIVKFPHGQNAGSKALALTGLQGPLGISFDRHDNLIVTNEFNIAIYAPPYNGAPTRTIVTQPFCLYSVLDEVNRNLYVSEQTNNAVDVYAYSSGTYKYSITTGIQTNAVSGLALDPP